MERVELIQDLAGKEQSVPGLWPGSLDRGGGGHRLSLLLHLLFRESVLFLFILPLFVFLLFLLLVHLEGRCDTNIQLVDHRLRLTHTFPQDKALWSSVRTGYYQITL